MVWNLTERLAHMKVARTLDDRRIATCLKSVANETERAMLLLSIKAGLRAAEIADLTWDRIDFDGNATEDKATGNQVNNQDKARVTTSNKELPTAYREFIKAWLSTTSEPKSRHRWKLANEAWMASAERAAAQARAGK
jgi:integrase